VLLVRMGAGGESEGNKAELGVRFRAAESADAVPRTSFLPPRANDGGERPATANEIMQSEIEETARRLGVQTEPSRPRPPPAKIDVATVDPLQALAGSAIGAVMFVLIWGATSSLMNFFQNDPNPFHNDIYVVQRLSAVIRTVLLTVFALLSGISGAATLGLLALAVKSAAARTDLSLNADSDKNEVE